VIVLGGELRPLGNGVAFVELGLDDAVEAYREWGEGWSPPPALQPLGPGAIRDLLQELLPLEMPYRRRLLFGTTTGWTAIFDNSPGGDPFPPTYLGRIRGVRAVAAKHVPELEGPYPVTQFHLFGPEGEPPLMYVRTIDAGIFDEGRWTFEIWGRQQPFEEPQPYTRRRIRDRFDRELLIRYLAALGITPDDASWYTAGVLADA
jgi:hypothetical protein